MYRNFLNAVCLLVFLHQTTELAFFFFTSGREALYRMLHINWIFRYCLPEIQAAGRQRLLKSARLWIIFSPYPSKKCYFASSRISIRSPYFLPLFIITFFVPASTAWCPALFASPPPPIAIGGVGEGAVCNCRPFAIVVSILATVAAYLHHPPPRSLFSISQTRCSRGLDPRGYEMDGIQTGV